MPERSGERVDDVHVYERFEQSCEDEQHRVRALDAECDIAYGGDDRLHEADCHEQPTPEIALRRRVVADALVAVHFELVDGHEHETADPQRKVGVERRDGGPVVVGRIYDDFAQMHGVAHEVADARRVET